MIWVRGLGRPPLLSLLALGIVACSRAADADASSKRSEEARLLAAPAFQRVKSHVDDLEQRTAAQPKNAQLRTELGKAYLQGGLRARATMQLEQALALDDDQFEARLILVDLALDSGDVATSRRLVDDGLKRKRSAGLLVADAKTRLHADPTGARDEARALLAEALALKPEHVEANYEYGVLQFERGEVADAVDRFEIVASSVPNHIGAHFNLARAYAKLGRTPEAERARAVHQRLARLDDLGMIEQWDTIDGSLALVDVLFDGGDRAGARAELTKALAHHPGDARLLLKSAECWGREGDVARARSAFDDATARYPDDARVMGAYARFLAAGPEDARDPERAVGLAQVAVQRTGAKDADALDALAEAYAANDQFTNALAAIREAERLAPDQASRKRRSDEIERRAGKSK